MKRITRLKDWLVEAEIPYHGILFDIDGTLVRGGRVLPGAEGLLDYLDSVDCPYVLVTNDSNHSHEEKARVVLSAGLKIDPERILSAGDVIGRVSDERSFAGQRFFVMGQLGNPDYAAEAGIVVTRELSSLPECHGVIVGEDDYDWQSTFDAVVNFFVRNPDAPFIVPNPDVYWPGGHGEIAIGAGGTARFVELVLEEYGVSVLPEYLGKPYKAVFEYARTRLAELRGDDCESAGRIVMVGDSLKGDIRGANRSGFVSILVLTGITPERQLSSIGPDSELLPDYVAGSL